MDPAGCAIDLVWNEPFTLLKCIDIINHLLESCIVVVQDTHIQTCFVMRKTCLNEGINRSDKILFVFHQERLPKQEFSW